MNENIDIAKDLAETLEEALNDCLMESFDLDGLKVIYCADNGEELVFDTDFEAVNHALNNLDIFSKVNHMNRKDIVVPVYIDDELKYYIPY